MTYRLLKHNKLILCFCSLFIALLAQSQSTFYFGADQSYVNEMEDCGAIYKQDGVPKDVYDIFADHGCNLTRLRLWHTPSWYDILNNGQRYSDLADVKKSIHRAKMNKMGVLLDFHLSDNWADPSKQVVPSAWLDVVDDRDLLGDSLYHYIYGTLNHLFQYNLLPEMVQIGNETNRGILLSPIDNQTWTLEWDRNAFLFNRAIQAVRDFTAQTEASLKIVLHVADPSKSEWWINEFIQNGVTDFDIIGMSYYWAWHKPTTISETGEVVQRLKTLYPSKEVLIVETGYIWTLENYDQANNIITEIHPDYTPPSPENQKKWLIDLTQEIIDQGGIGVVYWEPSWVSTPCWNQWDQGSHQEHATFFDFDHNLLIPGGIQWMTYPYLGLTAVQENAAVHNIDVVYYPSNKRMTITSKQLNASGHRIEIFNPSGQSFLSDTLDSFPASLDLINLQLGIYVVQITSKNKVVFTEKFLVE